MDRTMFFKMPGQVTSTISFMDIKTAEDLMDYQGVLDCYIISEGKVINFDDILLPGQCYTICPRLRGGKGGFGSMLRAIGAQIEKTTNREACRDLSGRRMRDVNNEKKMVEYLERKAEREREREKKKVEKLERLTQKPKHFFNDPEYESKLHEMIENVDKAVEKGIIAYSKKRKTSPNEKQKEEPKIKKGLWLGEEDDLSDSDSDDEMSQETFIPRSSGYNEEDTGSGGACSSTGTTHQGQPKLSNPTTSNVDTIEVDNGSEIAKPNNVQCDTNNESKCEQPISHTNNDVNITSNANINSVPSPPPPEVNNTDSITNNDSNSTETTTVINNDNIDEQNEEVQLKTENEELNEKIKQAVTVIDPDIDLSKYNSVEELENLGLDVLKAVLLKKGVKCGGSLKERAVRLLSIKDLQPNEIDPNLRATKSKKRNRSKK